MGPNHALLVCQNHLCVCSSTLSCVWLFATPWAVAPRLLCPWGFAGKNTGVGCYFLLQEIFLTRDQTHVSCVFCIGKRMLYHCATVTILNHQIFHNSLCWVCYLLFGEGDKDTLAITWNMHWLAQNDCLQWTWILQRQPVPLSPGKTSCQLSAHPVVPHVNLMLADWILILPTNQQWICFQLHIHIIQVLKINV